MKKQLITFAAIMAVLAVIGASCTSQDNPSKEMELRVYATPTALPSEPGSCFQVKATGFIDSTAPSFDGSPGAFTTEIYQEGVLEGKLCGSGETGQVSFQAPGYRIEETPPIYFFAPAIPGDTTWIPVTAFTVRSSHEPGVFNLEQTDIPDAYSIKLRTWVHEVKLNDQTDPPRNTVIVAAEGSETPVDLLSVRMVIKSVEGTFLLNAQNPVDQGISSHNLGGFVATERAMREYGALFSYGAPLELQMNNAPDLLARGEIQARVALPPDDRNAEFKIGPYLSMAGATGIVISWETDRETTSTLAWGKTPECENLVTGETFRNNIHFKYKFDRPREFNSFFHRVTLAGLEPDTIYYYRVPSVKNPTEPRSFRTATDKPAAFSFAFISDTQSGHDKHRILTGLMRDDPASFVLHGGDIVQFSDQEDPWLKFFEISAPILGGTPIFPTVGNHDEGAAELFIDRYFDNGAPGISSRRGARYYSFDWGGSHFVSLDATDFTDQQQAWMNEDLAAASADASTKFIFVFLHYPITSSFSEANYFAKPDGLLDTLRNLGVDAIFTGHVHLYERSDVNGMVHIDNGGGGGYLLLEKPDQENPYSVRLDYVHGYLFVEVGEDYFNVKAINEKDQAFDQVRYPPLP